MKPIEFCFDFASPWVYVAWHRLRNDMAALMPSIVLSPIYLRGLSAFSTGMPYGPEKLRYIWKDLQRHEERLGFTARFPSEFPINGLYALRGMIAVMQRWPDRAHDYVTGMLQATWHDNIPISDKQRVLDIAGGMGFAVEELGVALDLPEVKNELRERTDRAIARGAFGVPTFFVGDEMYWGQDRMGFVAGDAAQR